MLRLDYNGLKKRVESHDSESSALAEPFLELFSSGANSTVECTIECEDSGGARIGDLFMSLIHTCELNKANPFDYLTELQKHAEDQ